VSLPLVTLTQRITPSPENPEQTTLWTLALTAEERSRSRHAFQTVEGHTVYLNLPRGTHLKNGDLLESADGVLVRVIAKPEPVLTVTAASAIDLLKAAYHLGNRHVPLELAADYLRLSPDPVLQNLLAHRGLTVKAEIQPFYPELGAYGHHH